MEQEFCEDIFQKIAKTCQNIRLYSATHPAIKKQLNELYDLFEEVIDESNELKFGFSEDVLFCNDVIFTYSIAPEEEIRRLLSLLNVDGLVFSSGLQYDEVFEFFSTATKLTPGGEGFSLLKSDHRLPHIDSLGKDVETAGNSSIKEPVSEHSRFSEPRQVHQRALEVVSQIFADIRLGEIPSSVQAKSVVAGMAEVTLADPSALFALSMIKDYDDYTFTHSVNVSVISLAVGRACELDEEELKVIGLGGLLHDVGKLKVDINIINKPGKLSPHEFDQIKQHPSEGAEIVEHMDGIVKEVKDMVYGHHIHFNHQGYPVEGSRLSPMVDMVTIADIYDAMTTLRPYQRPLTPRQAIGRMSEMAGEILNPDFFGKFAASLGPFPVGSVVRLDTNEIALVIRVDTQKPKEVDLLILFDKTGTKLDEPEKKFIPAEENHRLVAEVDPFMKGIDVTSYFI